MFILFSVIGIAVVAIIAYRLVSGTGSDKITLSESKIVKKFNRLVRSINERNINTVKDELLDVIEEYKAVKVNQFIDSKNQISSSMRIINEELESSNLSRANVKKQIAKLKQDENPDVAVGASLVYQYERMGEMISRMNEIKKSLEEKDAHLEREIESAWGAPQVEYTTRTLRAWEVIGCSPEPMEWDDESTITLAEFKECMQNREIQKAEAKARQEARQNQNSAGFPSNKDDDLPFGKPNSSPTSATDFKF